MLDTSIAERCDGRFAGGREFGENPWFDTSLGLRGHTVAGKKKAKKERAASRACPRHLSGSIYIIYSQKIFFQIFFSIGGHEWGGGRGGGGVVKWKFP